ncbi:TadE/TadG family type IV pilus assembly protein [Streptomyces sp. NBC_01216]|uniref:TadE/TadG family type IV pilus assembly protein n=1 Tax=unclassified Streptomyces TaxID=2593676 RepID=UPI002E12FE05|nr:pilus assembly protein [Streptomyces sp. NBC_01216]
MTVAGRFRDDQGQVAIEFLGMVPLILLTLVLLWQCVLVGYTFTLAGNAADEAARAAAVGDDCVAAGRRNLDGAWSSGAVACSGDGEMVHATVSLRVPVLFPGAISFPFTVDAEAGAVREDRRRP